MQGRAILIGSRNAKAIKTIKECLGSDHRVDLADSGPECLRFFTGRRYEFTFIDLDFLKTNESEAHRGPMDYRRSLSPYFACYPTAHIIILSSLDDVGEALKAVDAGAGHYLTYPLKTEEIQYITQTLLNSALIQSELNYLRDRFWRTDYMEVIRTNNDAMRLVFDSIKKVSPTRSTVLLTGETGTGKTLFAKLIHYHSHRLEQPFIAVHCGAIPDTLIESELFGHEKGAFTGALRKKLGKFEIAKGGTIFLDEVGTISPAVQIRLLQVLQDKTFQRVGGDTSLESDVRIIAASNEDLWELANQGAFRRDLFFRLNVFPIHIPPLVERKEDIPLLVDVFLRRLQREYRKDIKTMAPEVIEALMRYGWPGNVRELENLIERAFIIETSDRLTPAGFPNEFFNTSKEPSYVQLDTSLTLAEIKHQAIQTVERHYLTEVLKRHHGSINKSAANAGISTRQLHKLMTKYGLKKEDFK